MAKRNLSKDRTAARADAQRDAQSAARQANAKRDAEQLPPDVQESDTKRPDYETERLPYESFLADESGLPVLPRDLRYYKVKGIGWVICTLHISNPRRGSAHQTERTYSVDLNGKVWTVGRGPHVEKEVTVYLKSNNAERLAKHVALWKKGMGDAGQIRDRISSRRAQGQLRRMARFDQWDW